jgi:hypothetical protein
MENFGTVQAFQKPFEILRKISIVSHGSPIVFVRKSYINE